MTFGIQLFTILNNAICAIYTLKDMQVLHDEAPVCSFGEFSFFLLMWQFIIFFWKRVALTINLCYNFFVKTCYGGESMINVIDLFSGAGGLTFGFSHRIRANKFVRNKKFHFIFANEFNHSAATAFSTNFPQIPLLECDIADIDINYLKGKNIDTNVAVDLVIGGPPCQSYSTVGKRQYDQRAKMYKEYTRILSIFRPTMFIFENVTGLLSMKNDKNQPVMNDIVALFNHIDDTLGYRLYPKVLNAKNYGVPQSRERVFIVGIRSNVDYEWNYPNPTNDGINTPYLTVSDAISDLPPLAYGETADQYNLNPQTDYQTLLRGNQFDLLDHSCGTYGEKITAVIQAVPQGEGRPYINRLVENGQLDRKFFLTSGYDNTYGRLWWDRPCTTITNSLGTPSALRCIHPLQNRALSTREGARIQSFPDSFHFCGTKYERNSQVGNAVPPLVAIALAKQVEKIPFENFRNG